MDPNATLTLIRKLAEQILAGPARPDATIIVDAGNLAALARQLDRWIGSGGTLPRAWDVSYAETARRMRALDEAERPLVPYRLPDGEVVMVDDSAAKGGLVIDYTLKDGERVLAIRVREGHGRTVVCSHCGLVDNAICTRHDGGHRITPSAGSAPYEIG